MASLELCPISEHLESSEIESLARALEEADIDDFEFNEDFEAVPIEQDYDEDVFVDFQDQLDANDANCDVYLPLEFEEVLTVDGRRYGSAHALLIVLANIKEDMFIEDEEVDDDDDAIEDLDDELDEFDDYGGEDGGSFEADEASPIEVKDEQMRRVWRALNKGARTAIAKNLALFVHE